MTARPKKQAVKDLDAVRTFDKHCPVSGDKLGQFPITDQAGVNEAVARARAAFPAWKALSVEARLGYLERLRGIILERGEAYAARISQDTGKPLVDSLMTELMSIPLFIEYYGKTAAKVLSRKKVKTPILFPGKQSYVEHFPMGVIAVIAPWNFPFQLAMVPMISALIAGNTVVLKPSEVTPLTGELIAEIFEEACLPRGVVEVVHGDGSTGAALTMADVDKIFFTGSVATGRKVMAAAAQKPIPVELELGGKDAMIVCADANLERAARAAVWGGFLNCGQMCVSVERLFVVDSVYDEFVALVKAEIARMKIGGPAEDADMGPMTFPHQIAMVERHIDDAREKGASIATGGKRMDKEGQFFEPTLVLDVTPEMEIYREETFGPVLPVVRVRDEEQALALANDHQYGLTGSVWTKDIKRGLELASRLECGHANVNDLVVSVGNPMLPFGGVKNSGFGRYHGPEGLLSFTHQKAIMVDRGWLNSEPFWFPYRGKYPHMLEAFEGLLTNNLPRAVKALVKLRGIK
jgi:acyl-CoA reductase-like NAD-dependent aldehyde dehydrogenase